MKSPPIEMRATPKQPLGMSSARFLRDYWQKWPLLVRKAFPDFKLPLTPDDLAGLACEPDTLSRIVLRPRQRAKTLGSRLHGSDEKQKSDRWSLRSGPFDGATFANLPKSHWTLLVQDVDKWDADVAAVLRHFDFLPSWRVDDVMVSYATDGGGVGAHVDQYDVFLLQGLGRRRWRIDKRVDAPKDFRNDVELKLLKRFSPTHDWTLEPGDMLYLPPGVPHDGMAIGECMTFSIGMRAPSATEMLIDLAHFVAEHLPEEQRYTDRDLQPTREPGEIDDAAITRVARALPRVVFGGKHAPKLKQERAGDAAGFARGLPASSLRGKQKRAGAAFGFARELDASSLRTWFGSFITRYRSAQAPQPRRHRINVAKLDAKLEHSAFTRDPWSRFAFIRDGHEAQLFVAGDVLPCPAAWAQALCAKTRALRGADLARLPRRAAGVAVLARLIDGGHLRAGRG